MSLHPAVPKALNPAVRSAEGSPVSAPLARGALC